MPFQLSKNECARCGKSIKAESFRVDTESTSRYANFPSDEPPPCSGPGAVYHDVPCYCPACGAELYCSSFCRSWAREKHESKCIAIENAKILTDEKYRLLRGDARIKTAAMIEFDYFGMLWHLKWTRPYMNTRYRLVKTLLKVHTYEAVSEALYHVEDMLHLSRADGLGLRKMVPPLMMRLGRDQEAYDFLRWYATVPEDYQFHSTDRQTKRIDDFRNLEGANMMEDVKSDWWCSPHAFCRQLSFLVSATLLKLRLYFALRQIETCFVKNCDPVVGRVEGYMLKHVSHHLGYDILTGNRNVLRNIENNTTLRSHMAVLHDQAVQLLRAVHRRHKDFWPALLDPDSYLESRPKTYIQERPTNSKTETSDRLHECEMQSVLPLVYESWEETPGAINWIRENYPAGLTDEQNEAKQGGQEESKGRVTTGSLFG